MVLALPGRPLNPPPAPQLPPPSASVDEELARAATASLSMGPATVVEAPWYNFALPKKLHRGLYTTALGDAPMSAPANTSGGGSCGNNTSGVPGFPDFPDFWVGESSGEQKKHSKNTQQQQQKQAQKRRVLASSSAPPSDAAIDADLAQRVSTLFAQAKTRGRDRTVSKSKRQQRRMARKAVNIPYGSSTSRNGNPGGIGAGKELKRRLRDQRRLKRIEMVVKLQEKRRRKREMGDMCRGMASIKCK
uniref:Uncharacterized protein n=1 Tax=Minutocellus polymorphus TaxID=265543 RepID=A0A7S0AFB2_9STRA|mmetsp:Transcript_12685/g.21157  ORF Transcript_12685/g.21157 Transcript_12685/m.21157 type:complete len:247 (+) Transcript_12685:1-741(+)